MPTYTPPVSPNVDIVFTRTVAYTPPVSPNVDIVYGQADTTGSGGGDVNSNSQFFLLF